MDSFLVQLKTIVGEFAGLQKDNDVLKAKVSSLEERLDAVAKTAADGEIGLFDHGRWRNRTVSVAQQRFH